MWLEGIAGHTEKNFSPIIVVGLSDEVLFDILLDSNLSHIQLHYASIMDLLAPQEFTANLQI